jgi:hypothetical protein
MKHTDSATSLSLMDWVRPLDSDGPLRSLIVCTYGLGLDDPPFFDHDFLPTVLGLGGLRDRGFTSPANVERRLGQIYCGLVCDAHALTRGGRPSLRVDVIPVGRQLQHAKVILIHRERMVRLIISSANLTHEGFRRNREGVVTLDFSERSHLRSTVLREFAEQWIELLRPAATADFETALQQTIAAAARWDSPRKLPISARAIWGGTQEPLWKQVAESWPQGERIREWHICSPFWPTASPGETPFERLQVALDHRGAEAAKASLTLYAEADVPGENARPRFPFALVAQLRKRGFHPSLARICPVRLDPLPSEIPEGRAEDLRPLHAKWMFLKGDRTGLLLLGSANFTRHAFGVVANSLAANLEACVLIAGPSDLVSSAGIIPPIASKGIVNWRDCEANDLSEPLTDTEPEPWPQFIDRIELEIDWEHSPVTGKLIIQCSGEADFALSFRKEDNLFLLRLVTGRRQEIPVTDADISALLVQRRVIVTWGKESSAADFPINIASSSKAGLPAVLGQDPTEQDLLAYFHGRIDEEDLMNLLLERAQRKNEQTSTTFAPGRELQNYVVREFLEGLYGMTDLLQQSCGSERSFEQALLGEFSPVRLANETKRAFETGRRTATATAFQILELLHLIDTLSPDSNGSSPAWFHKVRNRAMDKLLLIAGEAAKSKAFAEQCKTASFRELTAQVLKATTAERWIAATTKP